MKNYEFNNEKQPRKIVKLKKHRIRPQIDCKQRFNINCLLFINYKTADQCMARFNQNPKNKFENFTC